MPELPDVLLYQTALEKFIAGRRLLEIQIRSPFLLRTCEVDPDLIREQTVQGISRLGKRLILELPQQMFIVIHLMIAGRLHWRKPGTLPRAKTDLAAFQFEHGCLMLTEASTQKRAGMWLVQGQARLTALHQPGLDLLNCALPAFTAVLHSRNNTLKRALTDPQRFDGVGNAYSDEILHAARLSPLKWTSRCTDEDCERLWVACRDTLNNWIARLQKATGEKFPERVTAFRPEMSVHGKFGVPCPVCQSPIQRIRYAENECNYCARCQTEGRILADRSLSRLLKDDWPRSIDDLE